MAQVQIAVTEGALGQTALPWPYAAQGQTRAVRGGQLEATTSGPQQGGVLEPQGLHQQFEHPLERQYGTLETLPLGTLPWPPLLSFSGKPSLRATLRTHQQRVQRFLAPLEQVLVQVALEQGSQQLGQRLAQGHAGS